MALVNNLSFFNGACKSIAYMVPKSMTLLAYERRLRRARYRVIVEDLQNANMIWNIDLENKKENKIGVTQFVILKRRN